MNEQEYLPLAFDPAVPVMGALKKCWLAVLLALAAGMLAFAYAEGSYAAQYDVNCTLAVYPLEGGEAVKDQPYVSAELAKALAEVLGSPAVNGIEALPTAGGGSIRAQVLERTNLVTLTVTAASGEQAMAAMDALLTDHGTVTGPVMGGIALETVEPPVLPAEPASLPDPMGAFCRAALLTGMAVLGLLLLRSWFRDTVRGPAEAMEKLKCPYLGALRRDTASHAAALDKLRRRAELAMDTGGVLLVTDVRTSDGGERLAELLRDRSGLDVRYLPLPEALEEAQQADRVLLVLRQDRTLASAVNRAADALGPEKVLGCVVLDTWSTGLFDGEALARRWYRKNGRAVKG